MPQSGLWTHMRDNTQQNLAVNLTATQKKLNAFVDSLEKMDPSIHTAIDAFKEGLDILVEKVKKGDWDGRTAADRLHLLQEDLVNVLDKTKHAEHIEVLNKTIDAAIIACKKQLQANLEAWALLAELYKGKKTRETHKGMEILLGRDESDSIASFEDEAKFLQQLNPGDLRIIQTASGLDITFNDTMTEYSVAFRWFSFIRGWKDDMESLIQIGKASGFKPIVYTVNTEDPEMAEEQAKKAFELCRRAGYAANEITIKVGAEKKDISKLFSPEELAKIDSNADKLEQQRKRWATEPLKSTVDYRDEMQKAREARAAPPPKVTISPPAAP